MYPELLLLESQVQSPLTVCVREMNSVACILKLLWVLWVIRAKCSPMVSPWSWCGGAPGFTCVFVYESLRHLFALHSLWVCPTYYCLQSMQEMASTRLERLHVKFLFATVCGACERPDYFPTPIKLGQSLHFFLQTFLILGNVTMWLISVSEMVLWIDWG